MNVPVFQGKPLWALVPTPQVAGLEQMQLWAWLNLWQPIMREQSMEAISDFVAQGMVQSQQEKVPTLTEVAPFQTAKPLYRPSLESATLDSDITPISNRNIPIPNQVMESAVLESQLYQTARMVVDAEQGIMQTWYRSGQDHVQPLPVILAFTIQSSAPSLLPLGETVDLLNPLPLPQHGEYAIIEDPDGKTFTYHILQLPLESV